MGIDIHAALIKSKDIARLHQSYGISSEHNILHDVQECIYTERNTAIACMDELVEALQDAISKDKHADVIKFFEDCILALKNDPEAETVCIQMSY